MKENKPKKKRSLILLMIRATTIVIVTVALLGVIFTFMTYVRSVKEFQDIVRNGVEDVCHDMEDYVNDYLDGWVTTVGSLFDDDDLSDEKDMDEDMKEFRKMLTDNHVRYEFYLIDNKGIIRAALDESFIGKDLSKEPETKWMIENHDELKNGTNYEEVREAMATPGLQIKYTDRWLKSGQGFIRFGVPFEEYADIVRALLIGETRYRRLGESGHLMIVDKDGVIADSYKNEFTKKKLVDLWPEYDNAHRQDFTWKKIILLGRSVRATGKLVGDSLIIGYMPSQEIRSTTWNNALFEAIRVVILAVVMIAVPVLFFRRRIMRSLQSIVGSLVRITEGDLTEKVAIFDTVEMETLANGINQTVDSLKNMIEKEATRIDEELAFARRIQMSSMPKSLPERDQFRTHAFIRTAREVGGDFYDVFMVDEDTLVFLIADVSGKGIPAALFMMEAKTLIEEQAKQGIRPGEVFAGVNAKLCAENEAEMFITAWIGYLNIKTGLLTMANAGHNPFVYMRRDPASDCGYAVGFEERRCGLVLGMLDDVVYVEEEMQLSPEDMIYLYTDGVTEAETEGGKLFGEERLLEVLTDFLKEQMPDGTERAGDDLSCPRLICERVLEKVDAYTAGDEQTDDITMVCVKYRGSQTGR